MVILAALPGMVRELLVTGKIVHPGNSEEFVNSLGSQLRKVGLGNTIGIINACYHADYKSHTYTVTHDPVVGLNLNRVFTLTVIGAGLASRTHPACLSTARTMAFRGAIMSPRSLL